MNEVTTLPTKRTFNYNGMNLDDPDPSMPPEKVGEFYASLQHPELNNSSVKGPVVAKDGTKQYKFEVKIGPYG